MGQFTQTFELNRRAMSEALHLLPTTPQLFTDKYLLSLEMSHPLGIGSNQVEALRGWLKMGGLVTQVNRHGDWTLTELGELIAEKDPDLRRQVTWWLLHSQLAANPDATVYYLLFADHQRSSFVEEQMRTEIAVQAAGVLSARSVRNDMEGVLKSFESGRTKLASLGVLTSDGHRWSRGTPEGLTLAAVAYALYLVRERQFSSAHSMALQSLAGVPGGLQSIFGIGAGVLRSPLRQLSRWLSSDGYAFTETAGLDSLTFGSLGSLVVARRGYDGEMRDAVVA